MKPPRQAFHLPELDQILGGGLLPGTLTVIAGATGAGKTQLGLRWADSGLADEGRRGVICDLTSRGDAQNHADYAASHFGWHPTPFPSDQPLNLCSFWDLQAPFGDYLHPFARHGRRVTRRDLEPDDWHAWKSDLARVLRTAAGFFYGNLVRGSRRIVVDGIEPTDRFSDSIQFEFFEYLYHHVLRRDHDWAARELFREQFRANEAQVQAHPYNHRDVGCLYLYTTPQVLLDELIAGPIAEGDIFANANTIILMGRIRDGSRMGRGLYVAKHRGSACGDEIRPYRIDDQGLVFSTDAAA
jgi:KaiC/GvpD/RAD55 family RecA-like ATPase